jgi:hypothetical protein
VETPARGAVVGDSGAMRARAGLVSLALLGSSLAAVAGATVVASPASAGIFTERWCVDVPAPCIQSFSINGVPQTSSSPVGLILDGPTDLGGYSEVNVELDPNGTMPALTDTLDVVVNTGTGFTPQRMFGTTKLADVDTSTDGSGNHLMEIVGKPVRWTTGCNFDVWPWTCKPKADTDYTRFSLDIAQLDDPTDTSIGSYVGTNAYYNGIFFEEQPDGSHALTTDIAAPHTYTDDTVVTGSIRFRVSYALMRQDMGIPNPETLTSTSLVGAVRTPSGTSTTGAFTTWHDPDGGGFFIDASGFTFSRKKIVVDAARITPTRPTITRTKRLTTRAAVLTHTMSKARGARVTSYAATCRNRAGHVVRGTGLATRATVVVTGLRRGKAYTCQVVANSKAGRSLWSPKVGVRARP